MKERKTQALHEMGPLQREILSILWEKGPMTVHGIVVALPDPPHYVTILTVMRRMMNRGILHGEKIREGGGPQQFLFTPQVDRAAIQRQYLAAAVPTLFQTPAEIRAAALDLEAVSG